MLRDRDGDRADARIAAGEDLEAAGDAVVDLGLAHRVDRAGAVAAAADRVEQDARGLARVGGEEFDRPAELRFEFGDQLLPGPVRFCGTWPGTLANIPFAAVPARSIVDCWAKPSGASSLTRRCWGRAPRPCP